MNKSRRRFLKTAAAAVAFPFIVPRHVLGGPKFVAPSDKINIALVGAGGQGRHNTRKLLENDDAQVVAIADPAENWDLSKFYYKGVAGRKPVKAEIEKHYEKMNLKLGVVEYDDFRVLLEKEKNIDAILCATPDHAHAYVSVLSIRAGKHCYCEKPLTHNIWESRLVAKVAKETGVATQMGNLGHATEGIRLTVEHLRDGAIGTVREIHAWVPASRWNEGMKGKPTETQAVPAGLNWDLWLGPRAERSYHAAYAPVAWRDFWTFGCGAMGDFGCHDLDSSVWAYDLAAPESIELKPAGYADAEIAPYGEIGYYKFPAQGKWPAINLTWYSGGLMPPRHDAFPEKYNVPKRGVLFVGEKGVILAEGAGGPMKLFPESLSKSYTPPAKTLTRSKGHHREWLDAIKGGPACGSNFDYAARLNEITLLGVLSLRLGGKKIAWDAAATKAKGLAEADAFIKEPIRKGWEFE